VSEPRGWHVYLLECVDGSLYTGIAIDVEQRFRKHQVGRGARYTRSHPPRCLLAAFACADRSEASRFEHLIKQLSATDKRRLCDPQQRATLLAESAPPLRALQFACGAATGAACDATGISPRSNFVET
jgi:putative endonuclease